MAGLKAKTIKSVLRKKLDAWLETIDDEELRSLCARDAIVTGGCIASMLLGERVNDFDIYFRNADTTKAVACYYVRQFLNLREARGGVPIPITVEDTQDIRGERRIRIVVKSAGVESTHGNSDYHYFEQRPPEEAGDYAAEVFDDPATIADLVEDTKEQLDPEPTPAYRPVFLSSNAITLAGKIQLVLRFHGEPDEIHANYDFVHCTNYYRAVDGELVLRPDALQALLSRTLVYQGSRYPICSLFRLRKFIERGWRINAGQILKIALQVSELDLKDVAVLEDQLTGVDVAYFQEVIRRCQEAGHERIESAYLIEILDRMFGD